METFRCLHCPATWTSPSAEHCVALNPAGQRCCQTFAGTSAGDKHRTGEFHDLTNPRRCLTEPQMRAAGMAVNSRGQWSARDPQIAKAYFQTAP